MVDDFDARQGLVTIEQVIGAATGPVSRIEARPSCRFRRAGRGLAFALISSA